MLNNRFIFAALFFFIVGSVGAGEWGVPPAKREIPPAAKSEIALHIRIFGFDCPEVKRVFEAGRRRNGYDFKVYCGPRESDAYPWAYNLFLRDDNAIFVRSVGE